MRFSRVVLLTPVIAAALAVHPSAGLAGSITFGSDLSHRANLAEAHGADSVFWQAALAGGRRSVVPVTGQVAVIKLKGIALASTAQGARPPLTEVHFQVLHPQPDGSVTVSLTSQPFNVPSSGSPDQVSTYRPINLCARAGDQVAFNDEGGFDPPHYPEGVPFQVFSRVAGSITNFFTKNNGTNNGANFTGQPKTDQELLMEMVLVTGPDTSLPCRAGSEEFRGVRLKRQTATVRKRVARVRASCPRGTRGTCRGRLTLRTARRVRGRFLRLGRAKYSIAPATAVKVRVRISRKGVRLISRRDRLKAIATAVAHDSIGETNRTRGRVTLK